MVNKTQFPEDFYHDPYGLDRYVVQEKLLFEWKAPSKAKGRHKQQELMQAGLIVALIIAILIVASEIFLAVVMCVLAGLFFVYITAPPTLLNCSITTIGLKVEDRYYYWPQLIQFWFETRGESKVLYIRNSFPRIHTLKFIIQESNEEEIKTLLGKYLLYKKPTETALERTLKTWLNRLPLSGEFI